MTKEQAISIIQYTFLNVDNHLNDGGVSAQDIHDALVLACSALCNPSLPSNLDEAAEEYEHKLGYYECMNQWPSVAFKAGAEWMAGQGVTKEAVIGMATEEISISVSEQTLDELDLCPGDKVVVQVRKK